MSDANTTTDPLAELEKTAMFLDGQAATVEAIGADCSEVYESTRSAAGHLRRCALVLRNTAQRARGMVPLRDFLALARSGGSMRRLQKAYFKKRKESPHVPANTELKAARDAEDSFDAAVIDALHRERQQIPGMGESEGGDKP